MSTVQRQLLEVGLKAYRARKKAQAHPHTPPEEAGVCHWSASGVESSSAMSRGFSCTRTMVDPMLDTGLERHTGMIVCSEL